MYQSFANHQESPIEITMDIPRVNRINLKNPYATKRKGCNNLVLLKIIAIMICIVAVIQIPFFQSFLKSSQEAAREDKELLQLISQSLTTTAENNKSTIDVDNKIDTDADTDEDEDNRIHHCTNKDFQQKHKFSIWTMLNDNPSYVTSALKLGRALNKHTKDTPFDLVVMTLSHKPLSKESMELLEEVGFTNCVVEPIRPTHLEGKTRSDLQEKFGVLHVFAMTVYDTVLFLDADTFVQGPLDQLLNMDLEGKQIGVTKDIRNRKWVDTFNSGVMLLHPSVKEYEHLLEKLMDESFTFEYVMSDQGFLNEVYKNDWHEIGFLNNANLALYRFKRDFWDQHKFEDIRIIHYTMQKPWKCNASGPYGPMCKVWIDAE